MRKTSFKKYIEKKCGSSGSAQIPPRHGTNMCRYHQVNGHKCTKPHKVELSIEFTPTKEEMRWLAWPRSKRVGTPLSERNPNLSHTSLEQEKYKKARDGNIDVSLKMK